MILFPYSDEDQKVIPAPTLEDDSFDFGDAFDSGVRKILITDVKTDGINYQIDFKHNLDDLFLEAK